MVAGPSMLAVTDSPTMNSSTNILTDSCNCSILLEILSGASSRKAGDSRYHYLNMNRKTGTANMYYSPSSATTTISSITDVNSENECAAREYRRLIWNANRDIWMEWRQRPEYLASGDLYSIVILCLFASIILLLMVRAIKPNQSVDDQVTLLLSSMRVRVEFEDNVRQRRKLREAKLKAVRWLAEAKMRANMRKLSFRRSRSSASDTAHSADAYLFAHSMHTSASPTRSLFAGAFSSHCTGGKRDSSESAGTKVSSPSSYGLSSLISQSLSRTPSFVFPVQQNSSNRPNSPAKSLGSKSISEAGHLPPLHFGMHNVGTALIAASMTTIAPHHNISEGLSDVFSGSLDDKLESGLVRRPYRRSPSPAFASPMTPVAGSAPVIDNEYLSISRDDMRRLSSCSTVSSSMMTPRAPSTPSSIMTAIPRISSQRSLRQKDSWPLCSISTTPSSHKQDSHQRQSSIRRTADKTDSDSKVHDEGTNRRLYGAKTSAEDLRQHHPQYHERTLSFHWTTPRIVVQCDDDAADEEEDEEDNTQGPTVVGNNGENRQLVVDQQRLRRQLQQQIDANEGSGSPLVTTDDDEPMDDSSSSRPLSSSRLKTRFRASSSMDEFSQCDVILDT